jgi:hypothetical protein
LSGKVSLDCPSGPDDKYNNYDNQYSTDAYDYINPGRCNFGELYHLSSESGCRRVSEGDAGRRLGDGGKGINWSCLRGDSNRLSSSGVRHVSGNGGDYNCALNRSSRSNSGGNSWHRAGYGSRSCRRSSSDEGSGNALAAF